MVEMNVLSEGAVQCRLNMANTRYNHVRIMLIKFRIPEKLSNSSLCSPSHDYLFLYMVYFNVIVLTAYIICKHGRFARAYNSL